MNTINDTSWITHSDAELSYRSLNELFLNQIPLIRIKNFATEAECCSFYNALKKSNFGQYEQAEPPIFKIGLSQFEAGELDSRGKTFYFRDAQTAIEKRNEIFEVAGFNPIERLISIFSDVLGKKPTIAQEEKEGEYFTGIIRQSDKSIKLHPDYGQLNGPDWKIAEVVEQLAANLFITAPDYGGHTTVFNQPWEKIDEASGRVANCYSYHRSLVQGAQYKIIAPARGDLVLFNSRNYHEVEMSSNERFTVATFIGRMSDSELIFWS